MCGHMGSSFVQLPNCGLVFPVHARIAACVGPAALASLAQVSRSLRTLPYVEPTLPTLALVGAPNVGKSSLVRLLSSGVPEVRGRLVGPPPRGAAITTGCWCAGHGACGL